MGDMTHCCLRLVASGHVWRVRLEVFTAVNTKNGVFLGFVTLMKEALSS
jgi:hypothetical protein